MENSTFVADSELTGYVNVNCQEVYDMLVEASPPDYFSTDYTITTVAGTIAYALPSDFRSLQQVYAQEATDYLRPLTLITDVDRIRFRSPQGAYTVIVRYTPAFTDLSGDSNTFDGISGWEELVVAMCARDMLLKEESDVSGVMQKIVMLQERIRSQAHNRHQGMPRYITDVDAITQWPYPYRQSINAYQLRAGYLDLYTLHPVFP